jgi:ABC-2 type transport system ATP-binding protein
MTGRLTGCTLGCMITETLPGTARLTESRAADPVIAVTGLRKSYGDRQVLRGIDLEVPRGQIFGILGSNGAGKTTLVEAAQGLRPTDGGSIRVLGRDPNRGRHELRPLIGAQLQSSSLPDRLRVNEALRIFARLAGDVVDWRESLETWGLSRLRRTAFGALSGGERQRLFIALALINDPELVFLDEVTQGLDPTARRETWDLIRQVRERGATVVLVSHYMDEVEQLCDQVAVLDRGLIVACDTPARLALEGSRAVRTRFALTDVRNLLPLEQLPGVSAVSTSGRRCEVIGDPTTPVRVAAELARHDLLPDDFEVVRPSLEDAFIELTAGSRS